MDFMLYAPEYRIENPLQAFDNLVHGVIVNIDAGAAIVSQSLITVESGQLLKVTRAPTRAHIANEIRFTNY